MYLTSTGLVCPVGFGSEAACAAMRAGIDGFTELPYIDNTGEVIVGAAVPGLDPKWGREERLIQLLVPAIRECVTGLDPDRLAEVPLLVGLAEPERSQGGGRLADRIVSEIGQRLGISFLENCSRAIPTGRTAGFEALHSARSLLQTERVKACVVCGVDSYLNARSLQWLDRHQRLKTEQNSDGVIPGEAAAAVFVRVLPDISSAPPVWLSGLGFAKEGATVMTNEPPLLGLGLTAASKAALSEARVQMHEIGFRLSDVTGESFGFREQSLLLSRLLRFRRPDDFPIWHCSENLGDTGAASGIIQLIVAFRAARKGYSPGDSAICCTSDDFGKRAVAVIRLHSSTLLGG